MDLTLQELRQTEPLRLEPSGWIDVDQPRISAFAEATEDRQWIHVDPERAAETPFGTTIAHGFLLISLIPRLFEEMFRVPEAKMLVNYGLEKVRFLHPVPNGSQIRLQAKLISVTPRGDNLLLRVRGSLVLRREDGGPGKRAAALDVLFLVVPPDGEKPEEDPDTAAAAA
ncbi:MAG: MaoC family dehydratase, partial [Acidobacteriota bacterium]